MSKIKYIGLDFETSTGDTRTLVPIQIGIVIDDYEFESLIGGWTFTQNVDYRWSEESAKVHNIAQEQLEDQPNIFEVDVFATAWAIPLLKGIQKMNRVVLGWNVGSFDRQIVYKWMPDLNNILSYRTCDLNTVCYAASRVLGTPYEKLKNEVKQAAVDSLGEDAFHDALFDARAGLHNFEYLIEKLKGSNLLAAQRWITSLEREDG